MQPIEPGIKPAEPLFAEGLTNQFSFILESMGQPAIYVVSGACAPAMGFPSPTLPEVDAELADYVARMAGTPFDLDKDLEAASVEHLLSDSDDM